MNSDDGSLPRVRRRVPYFDRPKQPRDWRFWVGGVGKSLIVLGLLMFAFVAYQLWGTGIQTSQAQDDLHSQFNNALQSTTTSTTTSSTVPTSSGPSTTEPAATTTTAVPVAPYGPRPAPGTPVAQLKIASIGLDWTVVEGIGRSELKKGPGHFPETPMPGQLGNAAIAGHRTTYGHPFRDLDQVKPGDLIDITTLAGHYIYKVTGTTIVSPREVEVIRTHDLTKATLVLATCHPIYTTRKRLIVHAELLLSKSDQVFAPPLATTPDTTTTAPGTTTPGTTTPGTTAPGSTTTTTVAPVPTTTLADGTTDAFSQGWFADSSAIWQSILWGLALVGVSLGAYLIGKRFRRLWVSFLVGAVPFVVVLYFFFENVNRLLPPSL